MPPPNPSHASTSPILRAQAALDAGNPLLAEDLLRSHLQAHPSDPHAWFLLGQIALAANELPTATDFLTLATQLQPSNPTYLYSLAQALYASGKPQPALEQLQASLALDPSPLPANLLHALLLEQLNQPSQAEKIYSSLLRNHPAPADQAQILTLYSQFLLAQNQPHRALPLLRKLAHLQPQSPTPQLLLAQALSRTNQLPQAIQTLQQALRLHPSHPELLIELSRALILSNQLQQALPLCQQAVQLLPNHPTALYNLAYVTHHLGRYQEALPIYEQAHSAGYDQPEIYLCLGVIHKLNNNLQTAIQFFNKALEKNPNSLAAINNLGAVCNELGLASEAIECYQHAIRINPNRAGPHNNLASILKDSARANEAHEHYKKALQLEPLNPEFIHNYLFSLLYRTDLSPAQISAEHKRLAPRLAQRTKKLPPHPIPSRNSQPIRIGYLSPDYRAHPVASFLQPLLQFHSRPQFQIHAFSAAPSPDPITHLLRQFPDHWHDVSQLQNHEIAQLIHSHHIHILIELAGHTAHSRLPVLAFRPAPIQISYLGYPATTALPQTDFKITDSTTDPSPDADPLYTELLLRLPIPHWCYSPPADAPPPAPAPPSATQPYLTFGSFNNLAKINPPLIQLWAQILHAVPNSKLYLKYRTLIDPKVQNWFREQFAAHGIPADRLLLSEFLPKKSSHLEAYHRVDIALDTSPYNGTTTTIEALYMGVPVITLAGSDHRSRVGLSILSHLNLHNLISHSPEQYLQTAVKLANNPQLLLHYRSSLRPLLASTSLLNPSLFLPHFESLLLSLLPS